MLDTNQFPLWPDSEKNVEPIATDINFAKEENEKLARENSLLKKSLQKEQVLHNNLYKEWKELTQTTGVQEAELKQSNQITTRSVSKNAFNGLLIITFLLAGLTVYNLAVNHKKTGLLSVTASATVDTLVRTGKQLPKSNNFDVVREDNNPKQEVTVSSELLANRAAFKNKAKISHPSESIQYGNDTSVLSSNNKEGYKVKSKAYFYNEPDINTRRNAFIIHWNNRYATIKPLEEKNGFIYVVFTNHAGQTSKGWLLKSDLFVLDENR